MKIRLGDTVFDLVDLDEHAGYFVPNWILERPDLTALEQWWLTRNYGVDNLVYDHTRPEAPTGFRSPPELQDVIVGLPRPQREEAERRLIARGLLRIIPPEDIADGALASENGYFNDAPAYLIFPKGRP